MQCKHENIVSVNPDYYFGKDRQCVDCGLVSSNGIEWGVGKVGPTIMPSLEEANTIVNGERQDQYGAPEDSFEIIAGYWNVFLRQKIKEACNHLGFDVVDIDDLLSPLDATNMMVLFKQARKLGQMPKRDNYIDSIGYEAIGADRLWRT